MGILSTIAGIFTGGKGIVESVAEGGAEVAKDITQEPANTQLQYTTYADHNTWFDVIVDGVGRLIRPAITIWLFGGLVGLWSFPETKSLNPEILDMTKWVFGFWFGHRAIIKDLPALIRSFKN